MSQSQRQIHAMYDLQRNALAQTRRAMQRTMDLGLESQRLLLEGMHGSGRVREQGTTLSKAAVDMWFDGMTAMVPGSAEGMAELRESVHEQLDAGGEIADDTWAAVEGMMEQNVETAEALFEDYEAVVDDGFETLIEATDQAEEQTLDAAEAVEVEIEE